MEPAHLNGYGAKQCEEPFTPIADDSLYLYASSYYFSNAGQVELISFIFHVLLKKNADCQAVFEDHYAKASSKISSVHQHVSYACKATAAFCCGGIDTALDSPG